MWCGSGELNDVLRKTSGKDSATLAKIKRISKFTFSINVPYLLLNAVTFFDRISKDEGPPNVMRLLAAPTTAIDHLNCLAGFLFADRLNRQETVLGNVEVVAIDVRTACLCVRPAVGAPFGQLVRIELFILSTIFSPLSTSNPK